MIQPDTGHKPSSEFAELLAHLRSHGGSRIGTGGCAECQRLRDHYHTDLQRRLFEQAIDRRLNL
jgi:hypothetical protein